MLRGDQTQAHCANIWERIQHLAMQTRWLPLEKLTAISLPVNTCPLWWTHRPFVQRAVLHFTSSCSGDLQIGFSKDPQRIISIIMPLIFKQLTDNPFKSRTNSSVKEVESRATSQHCRNSKDISQDLCLYLCFGCPKFPADYQALSMPLLYTTSLPRLNLKDSR